MEKLKKEEEVKATSRKEIKLLKCKEMATSCFVVADGSVDNDNKVTVSHNDYYTSRDIAAVDFEGRKRVLRRMYTEENSEALLHYTESDDAVKLEVNTPCCAYYFVSILSFEDYLKARIKSWFQESIVSAIRQNITGGMPYIIKFRCFEGRHFSWDFSREVLMKDSSSLFYRWAENYLKLEPCYFEEMICELAKPYFDNQNIMSSAGSNLTISCKCHGYTTRPHGTICLVYQNDHAPKLAELDALNNDYLHKVRIKMQETTALMENSRYDEEEDDDAYEEELPF